MHNVKDKYAFSYNLRKGKKLDKTDIHKVKDDTCINIQYKPK